MAAYEKSEAQEASESLTSTCMPINELGESGYKCDAAAITGNTSPFNVTRTTNSEANDAPDLSAFKLEELQEIPNAIVSH